MKTFIVFDLETNGIGSFRPPTQTITQIAFIKFNSDGEILDQYSAIVKGASQVKDHPSVKITLDSIENEGIDPIIAYQSFINAIDDEKIIIYAHNAEFDTDLLKSAFKKNDLSFPNNRIICTMKNSTDFCEIPKTGYAARYGGFKWPNLNELASCLNIQVDNNLLHNALYDCEITKECVIKGKQSGLFK